MKVTMIKCPTNTDWMLCKMAALGTVGKNVKTFPSYEWKRNILEAEHSPIRLLWFGFELEIPYWVSVHLVRHHVGFEHFVQSQRDDRTENEIPRAEKPQGDMVRHIIFMNAQAFINLCHSRLCHQASKETMDVVREMRKQALEVCPEFTSVLVPKCVYRAGHCTEMKPCTNAQTFKQSEDVEEDDLK